MYKLVDVAPPSYFCCLRIIMRVVGWYYAVVGVVPALGSTEAIELLF